MALFGVNFSIYFFLLQKKFDLALKNTELRWYVGIILTSIAIITANILPMYPSFHAAVHHAAFSVSSVITTTGFCTENFDLWPEFSRVILAFLMIVGASAGSTGGGLKVSRLVILIRAAQVEVRRLIHPRTVKVMRIDGKVVGQDTVRAVSGYFILYVLISLLSILLVSLDGFDGSTTITAVLATFNNIGPGLGLAGPVGNFAMFSPLSKVVLVPRHALRQTGNLPDADFAAAQHLVEENLTNGKSGTRCVPDFLRLRFSCFPMPRASSRPQRV